jgi:PhoPQ-activated pathogenicity-related protein
MMKSSLPELGGISMRLLLRLGAALALLICAADLWADDSSPRKKLTGLTDYVARPEPNFAWKLAEKKNVGGNQIYLLKMTSQTWQNLDWKHDLLIVLPQGAKPSSTLLLLNTGGSASDRNRVMAATIASRLKSPVAFLFGIPNQPLFDGKKEDALIAETFVRFLETKDESWPLLFPMVKSVIKSMDALQAFAKEEWQSEVKDFVVTGASKRGWTSWLTGASGDPRVKAIAPMVIDTLNMQVQMPHQLEMFDGKYSEQIYDYQERHLLPLPDTTDARRLWAMVDPWVYREKLLMPKMIINGANDPYWAVDALNSYWDDLKGPKWVIIVPNAGHSLLEMGTDGKPELFPHRAINTLVAYTRHQVKNEPMPELTWNQSKAEDKAQLTVHAGKEAKAVRVWVAEHGSKDFRPARWKSAETKLNADGTCTITQAPPTSGYKAFYAEVDYGIDELKYSLCTQVRVLSAK